MGDRQSEWVVPPGKEDEYDVDAQGNPVHTQYGTDPVMRGTVVPSGKDRIHSGGNYGYTVDEMDIPQNIIAYEADGQRVITTMTRREMIAGQRAVKGDIVKAAEATPEAIAQLGEQAESIYSRVGEVAKQMVGQLAKKVAASVTAAPIGQYNPFGEELMAKKKTTKRAKKKATKKKGRRVVDSPESERATTAAREAPAPVVAKLTGPFGTVSAQLSGIFRDGMCLVLYTDARQVSSVYQLPESSEPMPLTVEFEGHVVDCLNAGIQFTMPNVPVTFTVLLIVEEEQDDGEGQPGQMGFDEL